MYLIGLLFLTTVKNITTKKNSQNFRVLTVMLKNFINFFNDVEILNKEEFYEYFLIQTSTP